MPEKKLLTKYILPFELLQIHWKQITACVKMFSSKLNQFILKLIHYCLFCCILLWIFCPVINCHNLLLEGKMTSLMTWIIADTTYCVTRLPLHFNFLPSGFQLMVTNEARMLHFVHSSAFFISFLFTYCLEQLSASTKKVVPLSTPCAAVQCSMHLQWQFAAWYKNVSFTRISSKEHVKRSKNLTAVCLACMLYAC